MPLNLKLGKRMDLQRILFRTRTHTHPRPRRFLMMMYRRLWNSQPLHLRRTPLNQLF